MLASLLSVMYTVKLALNKNREVPRRFSMRTDKYPSVTMMSNRVGV